MKEGLKVIDECGPPMKLKLHCIVSAFWFDAKVNVAPDSMRDWHYSCKIHGVAHFLSHLEMA